MRMDTIPFISAHLKKNNGPLCTICYVRMRSTLHKCTKRRREYHNTMNALKETYKTKKEINRVLKLLRKQNVDNIVHERDVQYKYDCGGRTVSKKEVICSPDMYPLFSEPNNYFLSTYELHKNETSGSFVELLLKNTQQYYNLNLLSDDEDQDKAWAASWQRRQNAAASTVEFRSLVCTTRRTEPSNERGNDSSGVLDCSVSKRSMEYNEDNVPWLCSRN